MYYKAIQKALDWGVKLASLAVTGPATWVVATELFQDITSPFLLYVMRFAAVFLVEGVLLSNWLLLEFDKNATPEIKVRYGVTAMVMYGALLVIAWRHEGPTGIVFRLALLAALIGSGWDTYVYTWQRMTASVDRSPENSGKVKRHARNLSIKEAILRREAEHTGILAIIQSESTAALHHTELYGDRLIQSIRLEDKQERIKMLEADEALDGSGNGKKKRLPTLPSTAAPSGQRRIRSFSALDPETQQLKANILGALVEDPNYDPGNFAEKLGVAQERVSSTMARLLEDGEVYQEGRGFYVTDGAEFRSNGKRLRGKPTSRVR